MGKVGGPFCVGLPQLGVVMVMMEVATLLWENPAALQTAFTVVVEKRVKGAE